MVNSNAELVTVSSPFVLCILLLSFLKAEQDEKQVLSFPCLGYREQLWLRSVDRLCCEETSNWALASDFVL